MITGPVGMAFYVKSGDKKACSNLTMRSEGMLSAWIAEIVLSFGISTAIMYKHSLLDIFASNS